MSTRHYWSGSRFLVEWVLVDDAGSPATTAAVTGQVLLPGGATAAMSLDHAVGTNVYLLGYTAAAPGRHGYKLTAVNPIGSEEGSFVVERPTLGLSPIELDPSTAVGYIRLLVSDRDEVDPLLDDADYVALLAAEGSRTLAAAAALETIARSEALVSKKISTQDLSTDGPAVAKELRESAKALRAQAALETTTTTTAAVLPVWSFPDPLSWGDSVL